MTTNRTIVELKLVSFSLVLVTVSATNRTIVELKQAINDLLVVTNSLPIVP